MVKFHSIKGFNPNCGRMNRNGANLIINPQSNDIMLFKMDPRSSGFSLSH